MHIDDMSENPARHAIKRGSHVGFVRRGEFGVVVLRGATRQLGIRLRSDSAVGRTHIVLLNIRES